MAVVKMNAPVLLDGEVTTIAQLADAGRIEFQQVEVTGRKRLGERKMRTVYLAVVRGTEEAWEIGRLAYLSRTGQGIAL